MKKLVLFLSAMLLYFGFLGSANAELHDRGGGLIYDDVLDVTWLQDANYAHTSGYATDRDDGRMLWQNAVNWAAGLEYYDSVRNVTWTDWRLPKTVDGIWVFGVDGTTTAGYNITTSEMGYMYYVNLGNLGYYDKKGNFQPDYGLKNSGPFVNLKDYPAYWSGTIYSADDRYGWVFKFRWGFTGAIDSDGEFRAYDTYWGWALRDGDVALGTNTVPVVTIAAPADRSRFAEGDIVQFEGTATDNEDGDLTASLVWISSRDGQIGTGASFVTSSLSTGTHIITTSVTDSEGSPGDDSVTIMVGEPTDFIDFDLTPTVSYDTWQDIKGTVTVEDDGATLHMDGNRWRRTEQTYNITPDTVLEFDFMSDCEGEIQGIGFDEDNISDNSQRVFQLFGVQTWSGVRKISPAYTAVNMGSYVHFSIPVGHYYTGSSMHLVFANDDDRSSPCGTVWFNNVRIITNTVPVVTIDAPADRSRFAEGDSVQFNGTATDNEDGDLTASLVWISSRDGQIGTGASFVTSSLSTGTHIITTSVTDSEGSPGDDSVTIMVGEPTDFIDFDLTPTVSYDTWQDIKGTVTVEDDGATLHMDGNRWRRTEQTYNITPDTVLEFDFMSDCEGEIQGIGFDEDNISDNSQRVFQLFGVQTWSGVRKISPAYTAVNMGSYVHFSIPVGHYYTGSSMHLVFANDDDRSSPCATVWFSNVRIVD